MGMDLKPWARPIGLYFDWLKRRDIDAARRVACRLDSSDDATAEGAAAEALVWDFLDNRELEIGLAETDHGGPDFRCDGSYGGFFVEVTNISRQTVSRETNLPEESGGPRFYATLTRQIKNEILAKATQFADRDLHGPLVIFVTTLHSHASALCIQRHHVEELLVSSRSVSLLWDPETADAVGRPFQSTDMAFSLATKARSLETTRQHISGVVVAGFGFRPPQFEARGALMPTPQYPFDPRALIDVDFCRFCVWPPIGELRLEWLDLARPAKTRSDPKLEHIARRILDEAGE